MCDQQPSNYRPYREPEVNGQADKPDATRDILLFAVYVGRYKNARPVKVNSPHQTEHPNDQSRKTIHKLNGHKAESSQEQTDHYGLVETDTVGKLTAHPVAQERTQSISGHYPTHLWQAKPFFTDQVEWQKRDHHGSSPVDESNQGQ